MGKTVAMLQSIQRLLEQGVPPHAIVRFAADGWTAADVRTLITNVPLPPVPDQQPRYWFVDEISSVRGGWDQQIKWLRDNDPGFRSATVVLTGSNAAGLTEAGGTLAGRRGSGSRLDRTLLPMGFRTFVETLDRNDRPPLPTLRLSELHSTRAAEAYASLIPWLDILVAAWGQYLQYGGFPKSVAAARRGEALPEAFVEDIYSVVSGDAFKSSRLPSTTEMALLERLWKSMAAPANLTAIAQDVGVAQESVSRHVEFLRDAYLLWVCPLKASTGWLPKVRSQQKLYAVDPLIARLPHLKNQYRADVDPTVLTEMQLGLAVRRRILAEGLASLSDDFLFFERTPSRKEIDFVAEALGGVALEGKYISSGRWRSEAATVEASAWKGILATHNVLDIGDQSRAWAVPAGLLAYLIDT